MRWRHMIIWLVAGFFGVTGAASASVVVNGTGEPAYTNTPTNTWFYKITGGVQATDSYRLTLRVYRNGALWMAPTPTTFAGPAPDPVAGWDQESGLQDGVTYQLCASGERAYNNQLPWIPDLSGTCTSLGLGTTTTIDLNKPNIGVSVNGTDTYSRSLAMTYRILYQDATSPPFPANFVCRSFGTPGACPSYDYQAACSQAENGDNRTNSFTCTEQLPPTSPDGPVYFCAVTSDRAVPDKPNDPDQITGSTGDKANHSDPGCGNVILDRTAPSVTASASATSVTAGTLVNFSSQASDATSGVGTLTWSFGDNTPTAAGSSASHTYTQPGTYQVTLSGSDGAGNPGSSTVTVTVNPSTIGSIGTTAPATTGGTTSTATVSTVAPTATQISQQTGGGVQTVKVGGGALLVLAPVTARITPKLRQLPLAIAATDPGTLTVTLKRGATAVAKGGTRLTSAGRVGFRLRLPKRLTPGKYAIVVSFQRDGKTTLLQKLNLRLTGKARLKERPSRATALTNAPTLAQPSR